MSEPVELTVEGCPASRMGSVGPLTVLLAGPPCGRGLFLEVQRRMFPRATLAVDLSPADGSPRGVVQLARLLAQILGTVGASRVFAHGLAVPVLGAMPTVPGLVGWVSNGPLQALDPVAGALARLPESTLAQVLRPGLFHRWMWSSAGMRRLVANPYVMDHDTVVALVGPWTESDLRRRGAARWLRSVAHDGPWTTGEGGELSAIWADSDPLYPVVLPERMVGEGGLSRVVRIPGGRHLHPLERPWAMADELIKSLDSEG